MLLYLSPRNNIFIAHDHTNYYQLELIENGMN